MIAEQNPAIDVQKLVPLKLDEPQIDSDNPWDNDPLGRQDIATRLTNLVANQEPPLSISLHGQWGTGKTFMLKRWQKALENDGFQAIYFNAWEDDFSTDPLLAIMGQISDYFKDGALKALALKAAHYAVPLIVENLLSVAKATVGVTVKVDQQDNHKHPLLDTYLEQRDVKDRLKTQLASLSGQVVDQTLHPLVFIIDELDRCRPTYAIELLERVKHIFEVPNLVFVFGLNRGELCKSLQSVYGEIDADIYLRRFFDMEFNLPAADSASFAQHLMQKCKLDNFFTALSKSANTNVHISDFGTLIGSFPTLWSHLDLSLRDIQNCVTSIALVSRSLKPGHHMFPSVLGLLITLRFRNLTLFRRFIQGTSRASEVIDSFNDLLPTEGIDRTLAYLIRMAEVQLYASESGGGFSDFPENTPLGQLQLIRDGKALTHKEYLSKRTQNATKNSAGDMLKIIESDISYMWHRITKAHIINLIELHEGMVRR